MSLKVVPTVTVLGAVKASVIGASTDHVLRRRRVMLKLCSLGVFLNIVSRKELTGTAMQSSSFALTEAKYVSGENIRTNALENVVKPGSESTITYIEGELDELEREAFLRLKNRRGRLKNILQPLSFLQRNKSWRKSLYRERFRAMRPTISYQWLQKGRGHHLLMGRLVY